eukprot:NODE_3313_length_788_cov_80.967524_g2770_i0.p1 GENE.NODE_3313_length_788_cov_80.967524_g2770_i0~~NODE_3313_length_788_cov_80.967524_g2770_i0.p1  ORF type:complete len:154 (+),score=44.33 NODE_3313_length_788_cov_80.967524_g2770_i0:164-625(+)
MPYLLDNLPPKNWPKRVASAAVIIHLIVVYPLYLNPVFYQCETKLRIENLLNAPQTRLKVLARLCLRAMLVVLTMCVALLTPEFTYMMSLLGSFASGTCMIALPFAIFVRLKHRQLPFLFRCLLWALVAFGVVISLMGVVATMMTGFTKLSQV